MKKRIAVLMVMLCAVVSVSFSQDIEGKGKGASQTAYEHASPQAVFNRVTDWFATVGKSKEEKEAILAERQAKRVARQAEKEFKAAQERTKQVQEKLKEKKAAGR